MLLNLSHKFNHQPYFLLFLATLFWAGNAIAGKLAVGHVSPFTLTFLRWLVVILILAVVANKRLRQDWSLIRQHLIYLFTLGCIGFALFNNLMYAALTTTSAINVALLQSSLPLFIFILNFIFFRVAATKYQLIGLFVCVLGVLIITTQGRWQLLMQLQFNLGDLVMLVAIAAYGIYSVLLTNKPDLHWLSFIGVLSCSAFVSSIPFAAWEVINQTMIWPDAIGWGIVLYTAAFASLIAQLFWIRSIELIGSNATGLFINLVPLLGSILAILLLDEKFHSYHFFGIVMIVSGVALSQRLEVVRS